MFQDDNENDEDENIKKEQKAIELQARQTEMLKRSEVKHRLRQMHLERKETSKAEKLQRAREASELKARQTELEQRLAKELSHRKCKMMRHLYTLLCYVVIKFEMVLIIQSSSYRNQ